MAILVVPYTDEWVAKRDGRKTWREHWLAIGDGTTVRGAYALKPYEWRIGGVPHRVVGWQGPVTEGLIDRRCDALGLRLLRAMLRKHPLLHGWGHGGLEKPMLLMLEKLSGLLHRTPFCVRTVKSARFPRGSPARQLTPLVAAMREALAAPIARLAEMGAIGRTHLHSRRTADGQVDALETLLLTRTHPSSED